MPTTTDPTSYRMGDAIVAAPGTLAHVAACDAASPSRGGLAAWRCPV